MKLVYDKEACVGAGECEALSKLWRLKDGRAELLGSKQNSNGLFELELDDDEACRQEAVIGSCPVGCIKLVKD